WANILTKLSEHRIPSILVNGRLSASSFKSYQKIAAVSASMMKNLSLIIAQDNESAKRFRQLGANSAKIRVAGSLKWVINTPKLTDKETVIENNNDSQSTAMQKHNSGMARNLGIEGRPIWVAASTHSGEEEIALSLQQQLLSHPALADTLLIIVPRHPERFDEVAALIQNTALKIARRSAEESITADTQVYLADSMGELMTWYKLADVALVGGSLVDIGGHNPVEPASVATPVIMGLHTQSCQSVVDKLSEVGALYQPHNDSYKSTEEYQSTKAAQPTEKSLDAKVKMDDTALIYQQLMSWLSHLEWAKKAGQAGAQMTIQQQAVLTRQFTMIEDVIEQYSNQALNEDFD
ncbi:MAG: 3-deoxy-D-manno-octulosonic acid transferase, partial [Psychrobacter sp.]